MAVVYAELATYLAPITFIYLTVTSGKRHPSCGRPPSHKKSKEPRVSWAGTLGGPDVNGTAERERRADFGEDRSRDEHKDNGDDV